MGFSAMELGMRLGIASGRTGKEEKICVQPTWFSGMPCWLAGVFCGSWGLGKSYRLGVEAAWKGEISGIHRRWEQRGRRGRKGCSAVETGGLDQGEQITIKLLIARDGYSAFILQLIYRLQLINENSSKKNILYSMVLVTVLFINLFYCPSGE